ncbi:MAG: hemolysin family protein [Anaerolineales bacterium]
MNKEFLELLLILVLISLNGFFALAELALLSVKKLRLQQQAAHGDARAQTTMELARNSSGFLSTVQIGITLVGVASGTIGGATIALTLTRLFSNLPAVEPYAESIAVIIVILIITYFSLVIGELVPKQIALSNPNRFAKLVAPFMQKLSKLFSPVIKLLDLSTNVIIKLLGIDTTRQPAVSIKELRLMIDEGVNIGVLKPLEETMLEQVLRFDDTPIKAVITPRPELDWLDIHASQEEIKEFLITVGHEKIPIADSDLDHILGMVYVQELLSQYLQNNSFDLRDALNPPVLVPESFDLLNTMKHMKNNRSDVVFVHNEFGGIDGMVATKDILEVIVGDLPEADEFYDPLIVQRPDGSWIIDGMLLIEVLSELLDINLNKIMQSHIQTLGGFVITKLGKIPQTGDSFRIFGYAFEVVDMDQNRVDKVMISKISSSKEEDITPQ